MLKSKLQQKFSDGVDIKTENSAFQGFRVSFSENNVYHDFSAEAIAEAVSAFLRPQLAEIVRSAVQSTSVDAGSNGGRG